MLYFSASIISVLISFHICVIVVLRGRKFILLILCRISSAGAICSVELDAVQQRLRQKQKCNVNSEIARAAAEPLLRRYAARPVGALSLTRVAAISNGDRGAAVTQLLRPRWKSWVRKQ